MKIKKLLAVMGLGVFAMASVSAAMLVNKPAMETKAEGTWTMFYVYAPGNIADYYDGTNEYDWLAHEYDAIEAYIYEEESDSKYSDFPGTLMNRLTPDVVGLGFNDTVGYDSLILSNCYKDNTDVRTRSTWDGATPISFDLSSHNMFTLSKFNCPTGADAGSFNADYGWNIDVKSGSDSDVALTYNGVKQFENKSVTLTAGTTFTIEDTLGTAITTGETGAGSAFTDGYIEYDSVNEVFVVKESGTYEVYAKPNVVEDSGAAAFNGTVWMQIDSDTEAAIWAEDFVENVGCKEEYNAKPDNWDRYAADSGEYSWSANLTNGAKAKFIEATASRTGTWVEKAAFIHDLCVSKYEGCDVFMKYNDGEDHSRLITNIGLVGTNVSNDFTAMIAVVSIIALVSISAVTVLVIVKKRKHN